MGQTPEGSTLLPVYIVGLEGQDLESSLAETRFRKSIESLSHVYPDIADARASVRAFPKGKERKHFEVHVLIRMPTHQVEFIEDGWSIDEVFEKRGSRINGLMTRHR